MTNSSRKESKVRLLLGRGSPRSNIEIVECWNEKLPCDKILPTFTTEWTAYQQMRNYFMDHKEYTHLVLATDDIVVLPKHIDMLQDGLELYDYPVLSGMMNVDEPEPDMLNLTWELPIKDRANRKYDWLMRDDLPKERYFKVAFSGFPLMAIRRDLIDQYTFMADRVFEGKGPSRGASLDLVFCYWCQQNNVPIWVDREIEMRHYNRMSRLRLMKADRLYFWPENGEKTQIKL